MGDEDVDALPDEEARPLGRFLIILGAILIGLILALDLAFWSEGAGFFSIVAGLDAATRRVPVINIDHSGLGMPVRVILVVITLVICARTNSRPGGRGVGCVMGLVIFGGSFLIVAVIGDSITTSMMSDRGYRRCPPADHYIGRGKSRTWIDNYVLSTEDCVSADPADRRFSDTQQ